MAYSIKRLLMRNVNFFFILIFSYLPLCKHLYRYKCINETENNEIFYTIQSKAQKFYTYTCIKDFLKWRKKECLLILEYVCLSRMEISIFLYTCSCLENLKMFYFIFAMILLVFWEFKIQSFFVIYIQITL